MKKREWATPTVCMCFPGREQNEHVGNTERDSG